MNKIKKKVKPGSKMDGPFQRVPNELLEKIFSSLPLKWVKVARLVCRRWFRVLNQDGLILNAILTDETIKNAKYFTKPHLASLTVKKLSQDILRMHGPRTIPPTITKLIIRNEIPFISLAKLLQYYSGSNINELVLTSFSLTNIGAENIPKLLSSMKQWNYLKILKLWAARYLDNLGDEFAKHTQAIAKVLEIISLPTLDQLSLNLDSRSDGHHYPGRAYKNPLVVIYVQLATFLRHHQKLKEFELKCFEADYYSSASYPLNLWKTPIVQLDSIKLELGEFDLNYMIKFLATQKKVKHVHIESSHPYIIDKLLVTNVKSLESITVFGKPTKVSLVPSIYSPLKSLTVEFYGTNCFQQFLSSIPLPTSSSEGTAFPQLINFNLIDTRFLSETYQRDHHDDYDDDKIKGGVCVLCLPKLLKSILNCFSTLQQIVFVIRGVPKHTSKINKVANCILGKVKELKEIQINEQHSLTTNVLKEQIYLKNCNIINGRKKSSSDQCYERSVQVTFCTSTRRHQ